MKSIRFLAVLSLPIALLPAQQPAPRPERYNKTAVMIPARDGIKLATNIFVPKDQAGPLPIIFTRTPYGIPDVERPMSNDGASYRELADDHGGYIFVFQDIRGRYKSEGQFVMQRNARSPQERKNPKAIDEATDAYDSIEWMLHNIPNNNGRVGMLGVSYPGWLTAMALTDPHPALRVASPQASPADMWLGDDFHHNGAFRLSYGFEYAAMMETSKENENFQFDKYDTYDYYLSLGSLANVNKSVLKGKIPTWNDFASHPDYDQFWKRQAIIPSLTQVTVPTLNVAGWWDQEDFYGPQVIYQRLEQFDKDHKNFLVIGPWNHGGWNAPQGQKLGNIDFGSPTSKYFRESIQAPFFAFYLKDQGTLNQPEAMTFEGGTNAWKRWDSWPPKQVISPRGLYFTDGGRLSFEAPGREPRASAKGAVASPSLSQDGQRAARSPQPAARYDAYFSDPNHPVPYRQRPIQPTYDPRGSNWYTWLTEDQRFVDNRPDVLSWKTDVLSEDISIAGDVMADIFAATTGTDADFVVKLIDVYPEDPRVMGVEAKMGGYEFMISNEAFRGRYRDGYEKGKPFAPNEPAEVKWSLHGQNYTFRKGHRIMIQLQSTWFPVIDRNPQTFVPNIFEAKDSDFRPASMKVYRSGKLASKVVLPVVTKVAQ